MGGKGGKDVGKGRGKGWVQLRPGVGSSAADG